MSDLKVTVELALTLPIPGVDYGMVKPLIRIEGIDPSGDVEQQLGVSLDTAARSLARVDEHIEVALSQMLSPETGKPSYRERLDANEQMLRATRDTLNRLVLRLKTDGVLTAAVDAVKDGAGG